MPSNKNLLKNAKIYVILDAQVQDEARLLKVLKDSVRFGVGIVQLRNKFGSSKAILAFCRHALKITRGKVPFILNDRVDLAILAKADGVHLGQDDIALTDARRLMGAKAIIGVSCQNLAQALKAQKDGADYIGFGSVFKTKTKPERNPMAPKLLSTVLQKIDVPVFPIGGITRGNIQMVANAGATRAAVCRDILLSKDAGGAIAEFNEILRG
jgi:thiamine-phosphate pyrophosphorylase